MAKSVQFILLIESTSDDFQHDPREMVRRVLKTAHRAIALSVNGKPRDLYDTHGNKVGQFQLTVKET